MNPMKLVQLKPKLTDFKNRHPKFFQFFSAAKKDLRTNGILEIKVTSPEGNELCTNIKLTAEDEAFLKDIFEALS